MTARAIYRQDSKTGKFIRGIAPPPPVTAKNDSHVRVRRTMAEGGTYDLTEYTEGRAWWPPNFRREGYSHGVDEVVHEIIWDTEVAWDNTSWMAYLGLHINYNKGTHIAIFYRHKATQRWGMVCDAEKAFLLADLSMNSKAMGNRLDEFVKFNLDAVPLSVDRFSRQDFHRCMDATNNIYLTAARCPLTTRKVVEMWKKQRADAKQEAFTKASQLRSIETGQPTRRIIEEIDGKIRIED